MSIQIKGLEKLIKQLEDLERKEAVKINRAAVRSGTALLAKANKAETPVGESGDLKRSETYKVSGKGFNVEGIVGAGIEALQAAAKDGGKQHPSNVDYLTEFGHVAPDGTFIAPTGKMRETAEATMPAAEAKVAERLAAGIENYFSQ